MTKKEKVTVAMYGTRKEIVYTLIHVRSYKRKGKKIRGYDAWRHTKKTYSTRFNFKGTPKQCQKAIALAKQRGFTPRKRFQTVQATKYIKNPHKYESTDKWTEPSKVESP